MNVIRYTVLIITPTYYELQIEVNLNSIYSVQVVGKKMAGDTVGEFGVICCREQPFTIRTTEICQMLRLRRISLMDAMHRNKEDGQIIMNNLFQVHKGISLSLQKTSDVTTL